MVEQLPKRWVSVQALINNVKNSEGDCIVFILIWNSAITIDNTFKLQISENLHAR